MVDSNTSAEHLRDFRDATLQLIDDGFSEQEIHQILIDTAHKLDESLHDQEVPTFESLPEGKLTVRQAADKYELNVNTVRSWVRRGRIPATGKTEARTQGAQETVIDKADLLRHLSTPPNKGGRPPKPA